MALEKELKDDLGRRLAKTDVGNLICGFDRASEKGMIWELLENQFVIMQVLAAMNGMDPNPKAYRDLLDK
jgi:hypothetical protein